MLPKAMGSVSSFGDVFLESCCDGSTSSSSSDNDDSVADMHGAFHVPGRPRRNGWRWRTPACTTPKRELPALSIPAAPQNVRKSVTSGEEMRKEAVAISAKPRTSLLPHTFLQARPPPIVQPTVLSSQSSVFGFYSFLTSPFATDAPPHRSRDRTFTVPWVADGRQQSHTSVPSQMTSRELSSTRLMNQRRTVYTAATPEFSVGDLSVLVDEHKVLQTTNVITARRDGQRMINDYIVLRELGRGSYGKVELVQHAQTRELYAMKILEPFTRNRQMEKRRVEAMRREVAVMKRVHHPHMVKLHEVLGDRKKGRLYMVMQYISGGSIAKKVTTWTIVPIPEERLRKQARQLLSALKYMLINSVVHRDIKPDNILVDDKHNAYLADFGMSAVCAGEGVAGVEGTPAFMSPEICRGDAAVCGGLADIWALGVSLYQLMYGSLPFTAPTQLRLTDAILHDPLTFPDERTDHENRAAVVVQSSPEFKEMIRGMLDKDPQTRWDVRKAISCKWMAPCRYMDTPSQQCISSSRSHPLFGVPESGTSLVTRDIAADELEEAIASLSESETDV